MSERWFSWDEIGVCVGDEVMVRTEGGAEFRASWEEGFVDDEEQICGSWCETDEGTAPECWTAGVCWTTNADEKPSARVTHWRPLTAVEAKRAH